MGSWKEFFLKKKEYSCNVVEMRWKWMGGGFDPLTWGRWKWDENEWVADSTPLLEVSKAQSIATDP